MNIELTKFIFLTGGNGDVEDSDTDVQDYSTDEDYNDVFDSTANGWALYSLQPLSSYRLIVLSQD